MALITFLVISVFSSAVPADLLKAQIEIYEAFQTSSIDSILRIPEEKLETILSGAHEDNAFRIFVLSDDRESLKKADSIASNNLFFHFYFFMLSDNDSVKEEELQWISDILSSKGMKGSKHLSGYFYLKAGQSVSEDEKLRFLNLSRSFAENQAVSREIMSIYWKKKQFSKLVSEVIAYFSLLRKPYNALDFIQTPLYAFAVFLLAFGFYIIICAFFKNAVYIWHSIYHLSKKFLRLDLSSKFSSSLILSSFFILASKPFYLGSFLFGISFSMLGKKEKITMTAAGLGAFILSLLSVEISAALRGFSLNSPGRSIYEKILFLEGGGNPYPEEGAAEEEVFASAVLCRRDKDFRSALELYSRAAPAMPKQIILNNRGCVFFDMGIRDSAYNCFQSAWRIDSTDPEINYNLYVYYLKTFQKDKSELFKLNLEKLSPGFLEEKSFGMLSLLPTSEFLTIEIIPQKMLVPSRIFSQGSVYDNRFSAVFGTRLRKTALMMSVFLMAGLFFNFVAFRKITVEFCDLCGAPVCNLCKRSQKGTLLCSGCISRVEKLGKLADEKGIVNEISESLKNKRKRLYFAYSMLLPGFVHNIKGKGFRFDFAAVTAGIVTLFTVYYVNAKGMSGFLLILSLAVFASVYVLFGLFSYLISRNEGA
ncbi:hypothetical protein JXL83_04515 [candidate division WOR-3 bacterium]|nr:hypothetical protein [candidate division WOR-3 bacterium]